MEFEGRKATAMAAISSPSPDKSPKGTLDAPIIPLLDAINLHPSYFTTSSCSGRITILSHRREHCGKTKKKAGGGGWVLVSHDPVDAEDVVRMLFGRREGESGELVFRFEPLIVAVECRDVEAAQLLVSAAVACGFRESGITSSQKRIMIAIRCSIRLEVPLGEIDQIMVSPEYIRYLVGIANEKMEANKKRTNNFLQVLRQQFTQKSEQTMEANR